MPDEPDPVQPPTDAEADEAQAEIDATPAGQAVPASGSSAPQSPAGPVPVPTADTGYTPGGVPTFESVREKIETRYGTAIGAAELDAESTEGRTIAEQYDARQRAAAKRLEEIRESMRKDDRQGENS
jgi:hypothetical protein